LISVLNVCVSLCFAWFRIGIQGPTVGVII